MPHPRTDASKPGAPGTLTLRQTAVAITTSADDEHKLKWFFEFMRGAQDPDALPQALIDEDPDLTGDPRFDALLAAAAEHISYHHNTPAPQWCYQPNRILNHAWWIAPYRQARTWALSSTPAAFRIRGIYIERRDLTNT